MRIVHIITSLESGGTERNLVNFIKEDRKNNEHIVFVLKPYGFFKKELSKIVRVYTPKNYSIFSFLNFFLFLKKFCKINYNNIQLMNSWNYQANLISIFLKSKKILWHIRSSGEKIFWNYKRLFYVVVNGIFSIKADYVIFNSYKSKAQHINFFLNKNSEVMQNGFFKKKIISKSNKYYNSRTVNFCSISRYDYYKNQKTLINAFIKLNQKFKNWKLTLIGKDNFKILNTMIIPKEIIKKIHFVEETKKLEKYIVKSHFHIISSLGESFPNVVGETMALGLPNIATNVGDIKYLIKNKSLIAQPENSESLYKSLVYAHKLFLFKKKKYKKISLECFNHINKNFSYQKYFEKFQLFINNLLSKKFLFILPTLNIGGAERVTTEIMKTANLNHKNIVTDILVLGKKQKLDYEKKFKGNTYYLGYKKTFYSFFSAYNFISKNNYKYVFSNIPNANALIGLIKLLSLKNFHLIVRESNMPFEPLNHQITIKNFLNFILRFFYFNANLIICPSKQILFSLKKILFFKNINKFVHMPNYIDYLYNQKKSKKLLKHKMYSSNYILNLSNVQFQKNIEFSIEAFRILLKKKPNYKLYIAGKIIQKKYYEKLKLIIKNYKIENSVYFLGFKKNPFNIIKQSKLVICTSRWEGMPNSLLQSVSLNKKIVSLDCLSGPKEIKKMGFNISIVKRLAPKIFAQKMMRSIENKNKINNFKKILEYNRKYFQKTKYVFNG